MAVRVTVTLPETLLASLDSLAGDDETTRSDIVREAAVRYVTDRAQGRAAGVRQRAVDDGIAWLETVSATIPSGTPESRALLRELRSGTSDSCAGLEIEPEVSP